MILQIEAQFTEADDGFEGVVALQRNDADDLTTIASVLKHFLLSVGFTYVTDVGIAKDDGNMVWGETL